MGAPRDDCNFDGLKVGHDRWVLEKQLGRGSYGQVWLAHDTNTGEKCAVKFESLRTPRPVLYLEYMFYKRIERETQSERIPKILTLCPFVDAEGGEWTCLVMECMGKSLEALINKHKKFSLKTTIQLAIEMLTIIEVVHKSGIIHRDIKPDNFMFGLKENGREKTLCIIDFGMSKFFIDLDTGKHIADRPSDMVVGTPRYQSANSRYRVQSRRDDLESICYVTVFFGQGKLPWQGLDIENGKKKARVTSRMKAQIASPELCRGLPHEFAELVHRVKSLRFDFPAPDYAAYRDLMSSCAHRLSIELDNVYDWDL